MRPIRGVVVGVKGSTLVIKLESGIKIFCQNTHGLNIGKNVQVPYDFTRNCPKHVLPIEKNKHILEINVGEPRSPIEEGENDDSDILVLDSGALSLSVGGFWELDSGFDPEILSIPEDSGFWNLDSGAL